MRLVVVMILSAIAMTECVAQIGWHEQTNPSGITFTSIDFADSNHGWAVGNAGAILHTSNGGKVWFLQGSPTANGLLSVSFADEDNGWAAGGFGTIVHTSDGGLSNWELQTSPTASTLTSVQFLDEKNGWAVGYDGVIIHTTNGGELWEEMPSPTTQIMYSVHFTDEDHGCMVGRKGLIYRTTNGGITWGLQVTGINAELHSVYFADLTTGWAVGNGISGSGDGVVLHTIDGGNSWVQQDNPADKWLAEVYFADPKKGWAVGGYGHPQTIIHTTNSGTNWSQQTAPTNDYFYSVDFVDANIGWIVGTSGVILHTTTGGTGIDPPEPTNLLSPANGSNVSTDPVVSWNPAPGALWYTLQVATSPYFNWYLVNRSNITETSYELTGLDSNQTYYWHVSLTDSTGTSGWTETWSFTTSTLPAVTVDVEIDSLHLFVPAVGDTFAYQMTLTNQTTLPQTVDLWTRVLRPGSNPITLFGPETIVLDPSEIVTIDTARLPVPYNAVEGTYSLVGLVGTYQVDTLDTDTTSFVKLPQIPCDSIDQFQAKCKRGGTIQARIVLLNSTEYAGEQVIMGIDGVNHVLTVVTNGTHSRAQIQLTGQSAGDHVVALVSPGGCFDPITVTCSATQADEPEWESDEESWNVQESVGAQNLPTTTSLNGNYPNPFNPTTTISYQLAEDAIVSLKVYNLLGQEVATLVDGPMKAGYHQVVFDAGDLASGMYFYRLTAGRFAEVKKMVVVR